jgi:hypothetical protein
MQEAENNIWKISNLGKVQLQLSSPENKGRKIKNPRASQGGF